MYRDLTPEEDARLLTQEQVDALPEGTCVMIKWNGGNGPHQYRIGKVPTVLGSYALANGETKSRATMHISTVSTEEKSPLTRVFLTQPFERKESL